MKTQHKLLVILMISAILLFAGFMVILNIQKKQNAILVNSGTEQQQFILKTAFEAKSELVYRTVYDYTYWDELNNYLDKPNAKFAEDNLNTLFTSFDVNTVWMYRLDLTTAYELSRYNSVDLKPEPIQKEVFPLLYREKFVKYYMKSPYGFLEINGATMHPSTDEARKLPPMGYFFVAKLLDRAYLNSLENLTGGKIELTSTPVDSVILSGNTITVGYPLRGWDGKAYGWLTLRKKHDFITVFQNLSKISTWFLASLVLVILIIFFISFHLLVNIPLNRISTALLTKSSEDRLKLRTLKSEFRKIGVLIEDYFEQREALETEIEVRKKTESQKEKLIAELDSANRELKDFAYIVSHDLKAPLRAIGSISQWIHTDYSDKIDAEGKMQLDLLLSRVHRMQNLIEGVLAYSRVTRAKEEKERIDLNKTVREAIEMVAPPEKFKITVDKNLPIVSFGPTRILQVFENLISNAVKYNDKEAGEINIGFTDKGKFLEFSVSDNGSGIEEKYYEKIFQIFQTLKARDEFESTGIGLTIVKKIIENNGGTISVDSLPGKGTTFTFTIPE